MRLGWCARLISSVLLLLPRRKRTCARFVLPTHLISPAVGVRFKGAASELGIRARHQSLASELRRRRLFESAGCIGQSE